MHGKRPTGDDGRAIKKQPNAWKCCRRSCREERKRQQSANDDWRSKAEEKFAARAREKRRIRAMRLGGGRRCRDGHRDKRFDEPDGKPSARRRLPRGNEGSHKRRNAHGHAAPSRNGGELRRALHGFANVFEMIGGARVYGDCFALIRAERSGGYHAHRLAQNRDSVKYFIT